MLVQKDFWKKNCFNRKTEKDGNGCTGSCTETYDNFDVESRQRLNFFQNIFEDSAKRKWRAPILNEAHIAVDSCGSLRQKQHSPKHQNLIPKNLRYLHLSTIMTENKILIRKGLKPLKK